MLEVARGRRELAGFSRLLSGGERKEVRSADPALTLVGVGYEGMSFG